MKTILVFLLLTTQYLFALISITPVEIGENPGLHTKINASLETKRGNTDRDNYKAGARLSYDNNKTYVTWGELSGEYGKSNSIENTNKLFMHIRYIHALTKENIRTELLGQVQNNKFKLIRERTLAGAGLRFKVFDTEQNAKGYFGIGGFYEHINYTSADPTENNIIMNTYLAYTRTFTNGALFTYTFYYQPMSSNFGDYIQSHKLQLKLNIYERLYLSFKLSYEYDSVPPQNIQKYDFYQETAFIFEF